MQTFDRQTIDSSGAFLIGQLERLDPELNMPLYQYTYSRDIQMREDVSIYDDISSFTNTSFAVSGTPNPNGKNWIGKDSTALATTNVDITKTGFPLQLWGMELGWTIPELQAAQALGRPIDRQKWDAMQMKWNMDNDAQVYVGDKDLGVQGMVNQKSVDITTETDAWANSNAESIREQINLLLGKAWTNSGYAMTPTDLLLPPEQFAKITSMIVSEAGNQSLLTYLGKNTISYHNNGRPLSIRAVKWLKGAGKNKTDRMVAYTNERKFVRFPRIELQSTPMQYRGLYQMVPYFGKLGAVELVYPETMAYADGI